MDRLTKDTLLWVGELNVQEGIRYAKLLTVEQLANDINRWSVTRPLHYLHNIQYLRVKPESQVLGPRSTRRMALTRIKKIRRGNRILNYMTDNNLVSTNQMKNYKDMSILVTSQINNELSRNTQSNTPSVSNNSNSSNSSNSRSSNCNGYRCAVQGGNRKVNN